ncbi:DUF4365 domain-containing protein [Georgenia faecalis]|uniref:DUF4365 domain-containing protein n=1 Tax=Georgenia faecalis TaxID=2483799 RepID=UPI000FD76DBF|nr:DUF4365 domain-containing protein [Georgenia faecalis]
MPRGPQRPYAHIRAKVAEQLFSVEVAKRGWIWHGVDEGQDSGIDGRVEVVEAGTVTSEEFTVQIKSGFSVGADGLVRVPGVRLDTVSYWHRKMPPTLVVVVDPEQARFAWQWAHAALPASELERQIGRGQKTTSLRLGEFRPMGDSAAWDEIGAWVAMYFQRTRERLNDQAIRGVYLMMHAAVAEAVDVLSDWVCWIAYSDTSNVVRRFVGENEFQAAIAAFEAFKISPGPDEPWLSSLSEPVHLIRLVATHHEHYYHFGERDGVFEGLEPVRLMLRDVIKTLAHTASLLTSPDPSSDMDPPEEIGHPNAIAFGIGVALITLRDWGRVLRHLLLSAPPGYGARPSEFLGPIYELSERTLRTGPKWIDGTDRLRPSTKPSH